MEGKNKQVFWTAYGKVSKVIKATNDSILYRYDATGQRISKAFKDKTTFYVRDASGNVMATYEQTTTTTTVKEINIYGSSRVGTYNGKSERNKEVLGNKNYELSNHLGNVLVTITDNKFIETQGVFIAKVNSTTDYYPFGMAITERTWKSEEYRYGFNTQEKDFDIDKSGNHTTAEFWEYDSRSGRRWNVDPIFKEFESPYACLGNSPIWMVDILGNDSEVIKDPIKGKKSVDKAIGSEEVRYKLTGSPNLYIFFTDPGTNYDINKIDKDSKGWDYVIAPSSKEARKVLWNEYRNSQGIIKNLVIRSHGLSAGENGALIDDEVLKKITVNTQPGITMKYLNKLLSNDANILFTACSIVQVTGNNVVETYGMFFLKNTDRTLFLNRTVSNSRTKDSEGTEAIAFNQDLVSKSKGANGNTYYWAGFLQINYNSRLKKVTYQENFVNIQIGSEIKYPKAGIITKDMGISVISQYNRK